MENEEKRRRSIRREREKGEKEREAEAGVAGNKRLANPPCQFNLASNPREMLIRASPPFFPALPGGPPPTSFFRRDLNVSALAYARPCARARSALYFRAKIPPYGVSGAALRARGNCVQSESHRASFFSPSRSLQTSTLVIYRAYVDALARRNPCRGYKGCTEKMPILFSLLFLPSPLLSLIVPTREFYRFDHFASSRSITDYRTYEYMYLNPISRLISMKKLTKENL